MFDTTSPTEPIDLSAEMEKRLEMDSAAKESAMSARRAMNATAYRIFKLLQWLTQEPLSVEKLNQRFCEDSRIGKPLSSDSIWLYINTLKALGCRIRRPSLRNQFCYQLLYHPFGLALSDLQLETLSQAKSYAQRQFSHQEMLVLDQLLKKVVQHSACESPQDVIEQLFAKSRSYDYTASQQHLKRLEQAIEDDVLLQLTYDSPLHGQETFAFLPELIFYEQGVVYARGERGDKTRRSNQPIEPSNLRLDRIIHLDSLDDPGLHQALAVRRMRQTEIRLKLFVETPELFEGFGLSPNQGVYAEHLTWEQPQREVQTGYNVVLKVRETFYLKQRLLSGGWPFQVVSPASFYDEVRGMLEAMRRRYQSEEA